MAELRARWPRVLWGYHDGYLADGTKLELSAPAPEPRTITPPLQQPPPRISFDKTVLDIALLNAAQLRNLIDTGNYRAAVQLRLNCAENADELVAIIATSGAFPALVELRLACTDASAHAIATTAIGLDHLERIDFAEGRRDELAVSDAAVEQLARSPRLPALRKITRGIEHHVYSEGSRDDTEVTTIKRDDGRAIESVVYHSI